MGALYLVSNQTQAAQIAGPPVGVATSGTHFTVMQVQAAAGVVMRVKEWGVGWNTASVGLAIGCDLMDSGSVAATVTAFADADISVYDPDTPAQASGVPFVTGTSASGITSSAEGTITAPRVFDAQVLNSVGGYVKQFPLGTEPVVTPGDNLRIRIVGGGALVAVCYALIEVV